MAGSIMRCYPKVADLQQEQAPVADNQPSFFYIADRGEVYYWDQSSTALDDAGATTIAPASPPTAKGRYLSKAAAARAVQNWFFSPTGLDTNDGLTSATPLKTMARWRTLIGVTPGCVPVLLAAGFTVTLNFAAGTYSEPCDLTGLRGAIDVVGEEQVDARGTLSSYTAQNRTSASGWAALAANGASGTVDFTTHVGKFYVLTSGAQSGARGVIESVSGTNAAIITPASTLASNRTNPVIVTPAGTETFEVRRTAVFFDSIAQSLQTEFLSVVTPLNTLWATFNKVGISNAGAGLTFYGRVHINDCALDVKADRTTTSITALGTNVQAVFNRCALGSMTSSSAGGGNATLQTCCILGGSGFGTLTCGGLFTYSLGVDTLMRDASVSPFHGIKLLLGNVAIHNALASRHPFNLINTNGKTECIIIAGGNIYGACAGATTDIFKLGQGCSVIANAVVPVATTTGAAVRFGSTTKTFANLTPNGYLDVVAGAQTAGENASMWFP